MSPFVSELQKTAGLGIDLFIHSYFYLNFHFILDDIRVVFGVGHSFAAFALYFCAFWKVAANRVDYHRDDFRILGIAPG